MKILTIEPESCTGCRACELVCSLVKEKVSRPSKSRIKVMRREREAIFVPTVCVHCEEPPCVDVCPVEALTRDLNTGAIVVNDSVCIGCRACMVVCPYGAIAADIENKTITKCDLCDGAPACVQWCPTDAIRYIDAVKADVPKRRMMMEKMSKSILKSRESQKTD